MIDTSSVNSFSSSMFSSSSSTLNWFFIAFTIVPVAGHAVADAADDLSTDAAEVFLLLLFFVSTSSSSAAAVLDSTLALLYCCYCCGFNVAVILLLLLFSPRFWCSWWSDPLCFVAVSAVDVITVCYRCYFPVALVHVRMIPEINFKIYFFYIICLIPLFLQQQKRLRPYL